MVLWTKERGTLNIHYNAAPANNVASTPEASQMLLSLVQLHTYQKKTAQ
jgi:hypothetical protein